MAAVFENDRYTITLSVYPQSSYGTTVGAGLHRHGDTIQLGAIPFVGYQFSQWSDGTTSNPRQLIVSSDCSFAAHFTELPPDTIHIHDTTHITLTDTLSIVRTDTLWVTQTDTLIVNRTDTLRITDTLTVFRTDTLYIDHIVLDTLLLHDTVYIHDTIYVPTEGIGDVPGTAAKVYARGGSLVVEAAEGATVTVYDAVGRLLATRRDEYSALEIPVPAAGVYLVRVGSGAARRIVVVR